MDFVMKTFSPPQLLYKICHKIMLMMKIYDVNIVTIM